MGNLAESTLSLSGSILSRVAAPALCDGAAEWCLSGDGGTSAVCVLLRSHSVSRSFASFATKRSCFQHTSNAIGAG